MHPSPLFRAQVDVDVAADVVEAAVEEASTASHIMQVTQPISYQVVAHEESSLNPDAVTLSCMKRQGAPVVSSSLHP